MKDLYLVLEKKPFKIRGHFVDVKNDQSYAVAFVLELISMFTVELWTMKDPNETNENRSQYPWKNSLIVRILSIVVYWIDLNGEKDKVSNNEYLFFLSRIKNIFAEIQEDRWRTSITIESEQVDIKEHIFKPFYFLLLYPL